MNNILTPQNFLGYKVFSGEEELTKVYQVNLAERTVSMMVSAANDKTIILDDIDDVARVTIKPKDLKVYDAQGNRVL